MRDDETRETVIRAPDDGRVVARLRAVRAVETASDAVREMERAAGIPADVGDALSNEDYSRLRNERRRGGRAED